MTAEVRREMSGLIAAQVDAFDQVLQQRDLARDIAAALEAENDHLQGCRDAAYDLIGRMGLPCKCHWADDELQTCERCELLGLLTDMDVA